jgi:hypothetical protein
MSTDQEIIEAVRELNAEIYEKSKLEYVNFYAKTDGQTWIVMFADVCLWNDDDDDRGQDPETEEYEPLVPFLRRRAIDEISKLSSIWENAPYQPHGKSEATPPDQPTK